MLNLSRYPSLYSNFPNGSTTYVFEEISFSLVANDHNSEWRMQLNNLLQRTWGVGTLAWTSGQSGPKHSTPWEAVAYSTYYHQSVDHPTNHFTVNGVEYGRGTAWKEGDAKELAARAAFYAAHQAIYGQPPRI